MKNTIHRNSNYLHCEALIDLGDFRKGEHFIACKKDGKWQAVINGIPYYIFVSFLRNGDIIKILEQKTF